MTKRAVALCDLSPSDLNPRKDFGDIHALANAIRATGGEPVNPIVAVKDGTKFRIVDGERRYRALEEIYGETDPDHLVDILEACDYDDALDLIAMIATDSKQRLTEKEIAAGVQGAFKLDIDGDFVALATNRNPDSIKRARKVFETHKNDEVPLQATFDAMIIAGEFDDPDEQREIIESEGSYYTPKQVADRIRKKHKSAKKISDMKDAICLPDSCFEDDDDPDYRASDVGLTYVSEIRSVKAAKEFAKEREQDVPGDHEWHVYVTSSGGTLRVYEKEKGKKKGKDKRKVEAERRQQRIDANLTLIYSMMTRSSEYLAAELAGGKRLQHLMSVVSEDRYKCNQIKKVSGDLYELQAGSDPSLHEQAKWIDQGITSNDWQMVGGYDLSWGSGAKSVVRMWDVAVLEGMEATEEDSNLAKSVRTGKLA